MRFIKAYIDGYGKFHDQNFAFEPGFNLFFGPNEAGKTTMMSFLRTIFFGFPGRRDAVDRYEPLAGGIHGGRLELETTDNRKFSISLKPGRTLTGEIIILNGDGSELSGESAKKSLQVLLHGVSENIYKTVFAFSLIELQRLESLENDEINAQIYSAGTGVGDVTLPDILKSVEEEKNKIYKHGGAAQIVPKITKEIERIRSEISDIKKDQERYKSTITEIENLRQEQTRLSHVIDKKRREKEKSSRLKAGRDNVNELNEIEKQTTSLPFVIEEFPSDGARRLDKLEEKLTEKKQELQECKNQINTLNTQIDAIRIDNKVSEAESLITSLIEDRSAEIENIKRKDEIKSNITSLKTDVSNAITDIGTDWDEQRVLTIDVGKETLQNIRVLTESLSNAQVNVEKAENTLIQEKKNKEESAKEFQAFSNKLEKTKPVIQLKFLLIFGIPIVLMLGAFCWMTFKPVSGIMALVLGAMIIAALYYIYKKSSSGTLGESKEQLIDILEARKKSIEEAEKALSNAKDEYQQSLEKWQGWLRDNGFSTDLDRNGIFALAESVRKVKELIRKKEDAEKELQHVKERAHSYLDRVNKVLNLCNLETTSLDNISQSIHKLDDTLKKQKGLKEKKEHLEERVRELEAREKAIQDIINDLENNIQNLIVEGGVKNAEEFRKHSNVVQKREDLLERKNALEIQLARLIGSSSEIEKFKEEVAAESDPMTTDRSIEELENEITQMERKLSGIMQDMGAKKNQISELEKNERLAGLRLEEENLKAQLQEALSEWSVNALCYKLLNKAMTIYERERQPFVLKHAGRYLDKITQGRYVRVIKKAEGNKLVIETPEGLQKSVSALSRGTAEQLYLSMRLAFIKEYANRVGTLPLIVDDILVNFDPQRAATTIKLLNEISRENQIIMFTCHPNTLDLCKKEIKDFKKPIMIDV
ncbi:MAG: Chromosome partition protein Smc [Candidatus Scalindua rubra]|uniref:Chromosome partition protein Smc n=1 Tax=Candidatus Scalindua rubra TaxID=1872076 RepID=A0A1E3X553_9BACT|nr:MAG: Chromosome partition protein Smc [Candidatus Scalindua rubra]